MKTNTTLLFNYLRASKMFGPRAGGIDVQFCQTVLGITNPLAAVEDLQLIGLPVEAVADGSIRLRGCNEWNG
jgi:hypothetical protein